MDPITEDKLTSELSVRAINRSVLLRVAFPIMTSATNHEDFSTRQWLDEWKGALHLLQFGLLKQFPIEAQEQGWVPVPWFAKGKACESLLLLAAKRLLLQLGRHREYDGLPVRPGTRGDNLPLPQNLGKVSAVHELK